MIWLYLAKNENFIIYFLDNEPCSTGRWKFLTGILQISLIDGDRDLINLLEDSETTLTLEGVSVERPEEDVLIFYVAEKNLHLFV